MAPSDSGSVGAPTKVCILCNKNALTNLIECYFCNKVYHKRCCERNNVKFHENCNKVICCESERETEVYEDSISFSNENFVELRTKVTFLEKIIREKDLMIESKNQIIADKDKIIELLNSQSKLVDVITTKNGLLTMENSIEEMKAQGQKVKMSYKDSLIKDGKQNKRQSSHAPQVASMSKNKNVKVKVSTTAATRTTGGVGQEQTDFETESQNSVRDDPTNQLSKRSADCHLTNENNLNLESDKNDGEKPKTAYNRNKKNDWSIKGMSKNNNVKASGKKAFLFVSRISPDTTPQTFSAMVRSTFAEAVCESIPSKHPDVYLSFKVCIDESNLDTAKDPNIWPHGSLVRRFFQQRVKTHPVT